MARASCEMPDSAVDGTTRYACASIVMPRNIAIASAAIVTSVAEAFVASGGLNEPCTLAYSFFGDDVRAAAGRIRVNRLSVRERDDREERGDHEADRDRIADGLRARGNQRDDDEVGRVRHRRQRVGREDGE